jgi:hypothetical protein
MAAGGVPPSPALQMQQQILQVGAQVVQLVTVGKALLQSSADLDQLLSRGQAALEAVVPELGRRLDGLHGVREAEALAHAVQAANDRRGDKAALDALADELGRAIGIELPPAAATPAPALPVATAAAAAPAEPVADKLRKLKALLDEGLIKPDEYERRQKQILDKEVGP